MLTTARHIARLLAIARTLAAHDALFPLEEAGLAPIATFIASSLARKRRNGGRRGQRLAAALQALGPSFIKLGQALSVRSDLFGEEMAEDLSLLQDRLPPFPAAAARATIEAELGRPIKALFAAFDDRPVAAASISQVHYAETTDGRPVAVKILRPGIEGAFARDLALFYWLAGLAERARPALRRLKPVEVVATFRDMVAVEMDLRLEAAAAAEFAETLADDPNIRIPRVDWPRTARRVLTLERIGGIPVDEREALVAAGHDPTRIIARAAETFFNQVFCHGYFHADMHPGNLFVNAEGQIVMVDFGIMGRLDRKTRFYLADMLMGFLQGDYRAVAEVHFRAGYVPPHKSMEAFMLACRSIGEPIFNRPLHEISFARLLGQLFQVTETFEMETQPQLLLLQKSMLLAEGVGRRLNPEVNMWQLARPLVETWMRENRGPEARLRETAQDVAQALQRLPQLLRQTEDAIALLADGGFKLHPDTLRALTTTGGTETRLLLWPLWGAVVLLLLILIAVISAH
ncbi:MAG TPA: 2-polyprenylphenol 6-hydroxylase [Alphaproteobacteria bacterium]|nr:2-polyprenylphenol 6-hydroxylase [Alphaproteobacteria bacterium]